MIRLFIQSNKSCPTITIMKICYFNISNYVITYVNRQWTKQAGTHTLVRYEFLVKDLYFIIYIKTTKESLSELAPESEVVVSVPQLSASFFSHSSTCKSLLNIFLRL